MLFFQLDGVRMHMSVCFVKLRNPHHGDTSLLTQYARYWH
jgi:hypothetical protein